MFLCRSDKRSSWEIESWGGGNLVLMGIKGGDGAGMSSCSRGAFASALELSFLLSYLNMGS